MPVVRISGKGDDGESEGEGLTAAKGSSELTRVSSNLTLSDHIGKFIAGEVATQFRNENLADVLKGKNMIMISASWG